MKLLSLTADEVKKLLDGYESEIKALRQEVIRICWNMRGGITLNDAYLLSQADRIAIGKIIEENVEVTKKTGLPYF